MRQSTIQPVNPSTCNGMILFLYNNRRGFNEYVHLLEGVGGDDRLKYALTQSLRSVVRRFCWWVCTTEIPQRNFAIITDLVKMLESMYHCPVAAEIK